MKTLKKIFIGFIASVMLALTCLGTVGCGANIKTLELSLEVYDYENDQLVETTLTVDLYKHLAPETVDAIIESVEAGYYDNTIFYKLSAYSSQIMLGDLKYQDRELSINEIERPEIKGEFVRGGTTGSNLTNKKGSVGLWRTWYASDDSYKTSSNAMNSGRATWYIPTADISDYNEWFCVFAQIDLNNSVNADALALIEDAFSTTADYDDYTIYYTGEYDDLTFNYVEADSFNKDSIDGLFVAEDNEYVCFNHYTVRIPKIQSTDTAGVKVVSAIVK